MPAARSARALCAPRAPVERGQALVETALVVPVLLLLAFGVVAAGRVSHAQLGLGAAVREAARAAALAPSGAAAVEQGQVRGVEIARGYGLTDGSLNLRVDASAFGRGGRVRVTGSYEVALGDLPLLGWVRVPLAGSHAEWIDPYRSWPAGGAR